MRKPNKTRVSSSAVTNFEKIYAVMQAEAQAEMAQAISSLRVEFIPTLKRLGIAKLEASYSGSGDEGCIDEILCANAAGRLVAQDDMPKTLMANLEGALFEFLPAGFEINAGGQGTLSVDVQNGKVLLEHYDNIETTEESTREWDI